MKRLKVEDFATIGHPEQPLAETPLSYIKLVDGECSVEAIDARLGGKEAHEAILQLIFTDNILHYRGCWFISVDSKSHPEVLDPLGLWIARINHAAEELGLLEE